MTRISPARLDNFQKVAEALTEEWQFAEDILKQSGLAIAESTLVSGYLKNPEIQVHVWGIRKIEIDSYTSPYRYKLKS